jgi:xanthine dehydrogenase accessory factor
MDIEKKAIELTEDGRRFCILTVVGVTGSAPRHIGSKMIVCEDGRTFGTIGGGGLEHKATDDAKEVMRTMQGGVRNYELTESGIQPCGGEVEIYFEPRVPLTPCVVFGAGHIGEKLCPMLVELLFDVTLVDERQERLNLPAFSSLQKKSSLMPLEFLSEYEFTDQTHIVCITHKHVHDEEIVRHCLGKPFKYLGLISSRKKWALFRSRYLEEGFTERETDRVSTPIGLDIGAETPFEIAVAVAAELIQLKMKPCDFKCGIGHFKG